MLALVHMLLVQFINHYNSNVYRGGGGNFNEKLKKKKKQNKQEIKDQVRAIVQQVGSILGTPYGPKSARFLSVETRVPENLQMWPQNK